MKYLIEKIDINPMENYPQRAVWYDVIGYVESEEQAKGICNTGRMFTRKDCWAIYKDLPEFKYTPIQNLEGDE